MDRYENKLRQKKQEHFCLSLFFHREGINCKRKVILEVRVIEKENFRIMESIGRV